MKDGDTFVCITKPDGSTHFAKRLPCGCLDKCDPYAHDTAPGWDGTPSGPSWSDLSAREQLAEICRLSDEKNGDDDIRKLASMLVEAMVSVNLLNERINAVEKHVKSIGRTVEALNE